MWHADPTTVAAEDLRPSDTVGYDNTSTEKKYYGQFATDSEGRYSMHTKKPGWYLNGGVFRPSHIHVKVYVGGIEQLTTQLYFEGDPFIPGDPWASDSSASGRIVRLTADPTGARSGVMNFTV